MLLYGWIPMKAELVNGVVVFGGRTVMVEAVVTYGAFLWDDQD